MAVRDDIGRGMTVAEAMQRRTRFFPRYYVDLVRAGEETGSMHESFVSLSEHIVQTRQFKDSIKGSITYLGVVVSIQCAITAFLMAKIIPTFSAIVADFGYPLPTSTRTLVYVSDWVAGHYWLVLAYAGAILILYRIIRGLYRKRGLVNRAVGTVLMYNVVLRKLVAKQNLARIASVIEKLLAGGVPLDAALESAESLDVNPIYAGMLGRLTEQVRHGSTLHDAMKSERWLLPKSFRTLVSIGESSGLLPHAFGRAAALYRRDVHKINKIISDTMVPVVVVILGGLTLFINGSFFAAMVGMVEALLDSL